MDFSYIFRSAVPHYECFASFGFEKCGDSYVLKRILTDYAVDWMCRNRR